MSYSTYTQITFEEETCCNCGVQFAMSKELYRARLADGKLFYCPNGHPQHYTESVQTKLDRAITQLQAEKDQHAASIAELERLRKRVSKGVCPCCKRHFSNLESHIKSKHPKFSITEA